MDWMPYPENNPQEDKEYLVSIGPYVTIAEFNANAKQYDQFGQKYYGPAWQDIREGGLHYGITAFMEKPKYYGE